MTTKSILRQILAIISALRGHDPRRPGWVYLQQASDGSVKVGLSGNPELRKRYLERDYGRLIQLAAVPVFNMKWLEDMMLDTYKGINFHKAKGLSGRTEWHRPTSDSQILEMIASLYFKAIYVNGCYIFWFLLAVCFVFVCFI